MRVKLHQKQTKKGVASLYVVIFASILFGVITLSFVRLILNNATRSTDDDLSQSAYDAAMVGVEDAKRAVDLYFNRYGANYDLFGGGCENFKMKGILGIGGENEVKVESTGNTEQAYTCVIIDNVVQDYRSTLTPDTRTRIVPLGVNAEHLNEVTSIEFSWYSSINGQEYKNLENFPQFTDANNAPVPPVVNLTLISMGTYFDYEHANSGYEDATNSVGNFDGINPAIGGSEGINNTSVVLYPGSKFTGPATLPNGTLIESSKDDSTINEDYPLVKTIGDMSAQGDANNTHKPQRIECRNPKEGAEFACTVTLSGYNPFVSNGNAFLVVSMPYGQDYMDFQVKLYKGSEVANFEGAQFRIDSTGRANDLYRRVETRLDLADIYFPVPMYGLTITGNDDPESFLKFNWITANCWTEKGLCDNNAKLKDSEADSGYDDEE